MAARRDGDGDEMREARDALLDLRRTPVPPVTVVMDAPEPDAGLMSLVAGSTCTIDRMVGGGRGAGGFVMRRSSRLGGAPGAPAPAPVRAPSVALAAGAGLGAAFAPRRAALVSGSMNNVSQIDSVLAKRQKRAASKGTRPHTTHACNACRDADKARSCSLHTGGSQPCDRCGEGGNCCISNCRCSKCGGRQGTPECACDRCGPLAAAAPVAADARPTRAAASAAAARLHVPGAFGTCTRACCAAPPALGAVRSSRDSTASTASSSSRDSTSSSVGRPAYVPVAWDEGEDVLDEKGLPKLLSDSSKRVLYSEIEAALQRACQGVPIQLDDFLMYVSDRVHREAGDGAVALSTKLRVFDSIRRAADHLRPLDTHFQLYAAKVRELNAAKAAPIGHSQLESDLPGWFRDWEKTPQGQYSLQVYKESTRRPKLLSGDRNEDQRRLAAFLRVCSYPFYDNDLPLNSSNRQAAKVARALGFADGSLWREAGRARQGIEDFRWGKSDALDDDPWVGWNLRKKRCDALSNDQIGAIRRFWDEQTQESPAMKDKARLRIGPNQCVSGACFVFLAGVMLLGVLLSSVMLLARRYEQHQKHFQWVSTRVLRERFNAQATFECSLGTFQQHKPFYVYKGKASGCHCRYCENARFALAALRSNSRLFASALLDGQSTEVAAEGIQAWYRWLQEKWSKKPTRGNKRKERGGFKFTPLSQLVQRAFGNVPVSSLLDCEKKSDVLRLLCCPFNLDNGDEHDSALSCLCGGKGEEPCCDCGQLKRLHRNHRYEALLWGKAARGYDDDDEDDDSVDSVDDDGNILQQFALGAPVWGDWDRDVENAEPSWFPGHIEKVFDKGIYHVQYEDGGFDEDCPASALRKRVLAASVASSRGSCASSSSSSSGNDVVRWLSYQTEEDDEGNCKSTSTLQQRKGHPSEFLDYFTEVFNEYRSHYMYRKLQKKAHQDQERHFGPGTALVDIDFSESLAVKPRCQVQSAYYDNDSTTVFVGVSKTLDLDFFENQTSHLHVGQEVTVNYGLSSERWAVVLEAFDDDDDDDDLVRIKDEHGKASSVERQDLSPRQVTTQAHVIVSDDSKHDTFFTQHALRQILENLRSVRSTFDEVAIRSDGAASHFKNRFTLHFLGEFAEEQALTSLTWDFGAPGHGKGPWDGIGGVVKHKTINLMLEAESAFRATAREVHSIMKQHFDSESWKAAQRKRNAAVGSMSVTFLAASNVERDDTFDVEAVKSPHGLGTRLAFSFRLAKLHESGAPVCLSVRRFSCGCVFCMREAAAAPASAGPSNFTSACFLDQHSSIATVRRKDNPGVALQRRVEQAEATKFCEKQLKSGKMLAFSGGEGTIVLGRVQLDADGKLFNVASSSARRSDDREACVRGDPILRIRLFEFDESTALFDPGLSYEANARSIIGPDTAVEYELVATRPPEGFVHEDGFDYVGCRLEFPLSEYFNSESEARDLHEEMSARYGAGWREQNGYAKVAAKGRKKAVPWIIEDGIWEDTFPRSTNYVLQRLQLDQDRLPSHPTHLRSLRLTQDESERLHSLNDAHIAALA